MLQLLRLVIVLSLVGVASVLATPPGRLPLALRGVYRIWKRDRGEMPTLAEGKVPKWKRLAAFLLILLAALLALI